MLDEALPTFFLKPAGDKLKHHESFYYTQHGSEPDARYSLHHVDPATNEARNTYAAALFDAYSPDILYGEVLAKPGWQQPTLSLEEIRKNGGIPPPPQPIFPTEFAIQLYNPDQQVIVRQQTTKWSGSVSYEFTMPVVTFRTPSASSLDRSQDDPTADIVTPKINFAWKKEGRIGKDMTCYLTGKSTDLVGKKSKKSKEPDIAVALFSGMKEMTIMESNLYRVEVEDYKGLEVVLLLGAAVIRDLFFANTRESFHITDTDMRKNSTGLRGRKGSSPLEPVSITPPVMTPKPPLQQHPIQQPMQPAKPAALNGLYSQSSRNVAKRTSLPPLQTGNQPTPQLDPHAKWEIDAETERLKAEVEAEAREYRRQEEMKRRARKKAEEEEIRKTTQFLEREERQRLKAQKERTRRQVEVDKETERLRRQYGSQGTLFAPAQPQQRRSTPTIQNQWQNLHPTNAAIQPPRLVAQGPYLQPPNGHHPAIPQSSLFGSSLPKPPDNPKMKKKSFWGLRSVSEQSPTILRKKQSSMF